MTIGSTTGTAAGPARSRLPAAAAALLLAGGIALAGCQNMSTSEKGAAGGAALGSGIAMVAGGGLVSTVGAGLIGGAAGYLGGEIVDKNQ
jgi:hypothetical protein